MADEKTRVSKYLSFVLRHDPGAIGIVLDRNGWAEVDILLAQCRAHGKEISRAMLEDVVATNPKRRFALSDDGLRIRANQGHSIEVDLAYAPAEPPEMLFHGTVVAALPAIRAEGLKRMQRHHVHLSPDVTTATTVGGRRGTAVILRVRAGTMHRDGHLFYLSTNGVWLTEKVPPGQIEFPPEPAR
jgi:putative RNA 2'-phosphotransferase